MKDIIISKLNEIEQRENVRVLYAVESGSRAWGFESPDSDFDVRFIYVKPMAEYLRIDRVRDVIEWELNETLDINGWDLQKTLLLLRNSNPTLFEWANSPIVYKQTPEWETVAKVFPDYFLSKPGLFHYLSMAAGNYREYLKSELVRIKKYLYVLRPILACKWILRNGTPPPMRFSELVESQLEPEILPAVERLLDIKRLSPETEMMPRVPELNDYIERNILLIQEQAEQLPGERKSGYGELNEIFLRLVKE